MKEIPRPTKTIQQVLDETRHRRVRMARYDINKTLPAKKKPNTAKPS